MESMRLANGLDVYHLDAGQTEFAFREIFLDRCYLQHGIQLHGGDVVWDVGANIGLASLFFSMEQPNVTVFAFEPAPATFEVLRANFERSDIRGRAHPYGLFSSETAKPFRYYPRSSAMSGIAADAEHDARVTRTYLRNSGLTEEDARFVVESRFESAMLECQFTTLSAVVRETAVDVISLLKVDVENAEMQVLAGINDADWRRIQQIVMEVHRDESLRAVGNALVARGFQVTVEQDSLLHGTEMTMLFARRDMRS